MAKMTQAEKASKWDKQRANQRKNTIKRQLVYELAVQRGLDKEVTDQMVAERIKKIDG